MAHLWLELRPSDRPRIIGQDDHVCVFVDKIHKIRICGYDLRNICRCCVMNFLYTNIGALLTVRLFGPDYLIATSHHQVFRTKSERIQCKWCNKTQQGYEDKPRSERLEIGSTSRANQRNAIVPIDPTSQCHCRCTFNVERVTPLPTPNTRLSTWIGNKLYRTVRS
jgi:hypothetical protein